MENEISEIYRKFLISITLDNLKFYAIWGTDLSDNDNDKLLLNDKNLIITFKNIKNLDLAFSNNLYQYFDIKNLFKWFNEFKENDSYIDYDLDNIKNSVKTIFFLENKEICISILNFIHLFQDYAIQINNKILIKRVEDENIKFFIDFVYDNYFWNNKNFIKIDDNFNKIKFIRQISFLIQSFKKHFYLID
jgi:hypothetical protein